MSSPTKTTTSTPSYSADQGSIQSLLAEALKKRLAGGGAGELDPLKANAVGQVNQNYAGLQSKLSSTLSAHGFGGSGKAALSTAQTEVGRQSDLGGVESQFAGLQLDQENKTASLADQFGFANPTTTQTQKTSGGLLGGLMSAAGLVFGLSTGGGGGGGGGLFSSLSGMFGGGKLMHTEGANEGSGEG